MKTGWASNRTDPDEDYVRRARSLLYKHHPGTAYHSGGIWRAMMVLRLGRWAGRDVVNLSPSDEGVNGLLEYFAANPSAVPRGIELDVVPVANPDGLASGSRQFSSGVDPNRNWGGSDWRSDAFDSNAAFRVGLGGPEPFSEPETQALADWILANRPALVVNYHSAGGFMFGARGGLASGRSGALE